MATDNAGRPVGDSERDPYEPRTREGTYRDRRHGGMEFKNDGSMEFRHPDGYGGDAYRSNPGYRGSYPYGRKAQQEYPGYTNEGQQRPYYGSADSYDAHVDVDPELFRHMVRAVRQVDGERGKRDGRERKDSAPRVRHYLIGPR